MKIDSNRQGIPTAVLVSVSLPDEPNETGKYDAVFIPIDEILKLQNTDRTLNGHPWADVPPEHLITHEISKKEYDKIVRYTSGKKFISISAVGLRGIKSRGVKLDKNGEPMVRYKISWRNPAKYLSESDIFWLQEVSEESFRFSYAITLVDAISGYFQRLSASLAKQSKPKYKSKRIKAKIRRQMARIDNKSY